MQELWLGKNLVRAWVDGVEFEDAARAQVANMANMEIIHSHVAVMPDVHAGKGATVGTVFATDGAAIPAAVGVDIGCGLIAQRLSLRAEQLPDDLSAVRAAIERAVPVGFGVHQHVPASVTTAYAHLDGGLRDVLAKHPKIDDGARAILQLGTLGGGNHFLSVNLDEGDQVWLLLHSGSRGIGNKIGSYFIEIAKREMERLGIGLADKDLAYLREGTAHFDDYVEGLSWAQDYARTSRDVMMARGLDAIRPLLPPFTLAERAINCHHNYLTREFHFGKSVLVTRKGAVRAGLGDLGVIPGCMGGKSFIVEGRGNPLSFESCSHGAGRRMSRGHARRTLTVEDLVAQTAGVECRKDAGVIDEMPACYKDVFAVMEAQKDLVDIKHVLQEIACIKG